MSQSLLMGPSSEGPFLFPTLPHARRINPKENLR